MKMDDNYSGAMSIMASTTAASSLYPASSFRDGAIS